MSRRILLILSLLLLTFGGISLQAQVTADFSASPTRGCSPLVVSFTDLSTGPVTSWQWYFGNGNGSTLQDPSAAYLTPGIYDITLIVSDGTNWDTIVRPGYVRVYQDPQPAFSADDTVGCEPHTVSFTNLTVPGDTAVASYIWDFGDGGFSTAINPIHTYSTPGTYTVSLVASDYHGCQDQIVVTDYITIYEDAVANFSSTNNSGCAVPLTTNFTNLSTGGGTLSYFWDFGDGTTSTDTNPSHTYTAFGNYDVTLVVTTSEGCNDTIVMPSHVTIGNVVADFVADTVTGCEGTTINFSDLTNPAPTSWAWNFGDGGTSTLQNPSHTYNSAGTYDVSLNVGLAGCTDNETKVTYITILPPPTASFTGTNVSACSAPLTANFTDTSPDAVSWLWDFGDGNTSTLQNPSHTYTSDGSYTVSLTITSSDGCVNTVTQPGFVNIVPPVADLIPIDPTAGCVPYTMTFNDASTSPWDPIVSWNWDFGDGGTSNLANPTYTFNDTGTFSISLVVTTAGGCTDTITYADMVMVGEPVIIDFIASPLQSCLFDDIAFTNLSTPAGNQWFWDFGDGGISTLQNPFYQYGDTGWFDISLTVINNGCPTDTTFEQYIHISPPDARFNFVQNCDDPFTVQFNDNSLAPQTWQWSFGTGDTSHIQNPIYTFPDTGTYTVTLMVTDTSSGCMDIETQTVTIYNPIANFSGDPLIGCRTLSVQFTDSSQHANYHRWYFNPGSFSGPSSFPHISNPYRNFSTPGTYSVVLVITDPLGCQDSMLREDYITVTGPTANFTGSPLAGCNPLTVNFTDASTEFLGTITNWHWEFGDGTTDSVQNPTHTYTATGNYTIRLTVTDDNGCTHTRTRNNYVSVTQPVALFTNDTLLCPGEVGSFTNLSTGAGLSYVWDFGDGNTSTSANPTHAYVADGSYTVSLTATDVNGCDSTITGTVNVVSPTASFDSDTNFSSCPPLLVNFNDLSVGNNITSWFWDFGDGATSTDQHPSHLYTVAGSFDVTLVITTAAGCVDTMFIPDYAVLNGPIGTFDFSPQQGCIPLDVTFEAVTINSAINTWDMGDGNVVIAGDTLIYTYTTTGTFNPVLIMDDGLGCVTAYDPPDNVLAGDVVASFTSNAGQYCGSGTVNFTSTHTSYPLATSYYWDFGDGSTSTAMNPSHNYTASGVYDVMFVVSNGLCTDTVIQPAEVIIDPIPNANFMAIDSIGCRDLVANFSDLSFSDSTIVAWSWTFGDGAIESIQNPTHIYTTAGTYNAQLHIIASSGCVDSISKTIVVHDLPTVTASNDTAICAGETAQLTATGATTYNWSPATGLSNPNIANPTATPAATTTYIVTGTDVNGCVDWDTVTVTINPLPITSITPDDSLCIGDSLQLTATGGQFYNWTPATGLSATNIANPIAFPTVTTLYQVAISDTNGCSVTENVNIIVNPLPIGLLSNDTAVCVGSPVNLNAAGGVSYSWSPATGLSDPSIANPIATPTDTITYTLTTTNASGCVTVDSITIDVVQYPIASVSPDTAVCEGQTVQLLASGGDNYSWTPALGLSCTNCPNPISSPSADILYHVTISNAFGCTVEDSVEVLVNSIPSANFVALDSTGCVNLTANFTDLSTSDSTIVSWAWNFDDGNTSSLQNPTNIYTSGGTYNATLVITTNTGCVDSITKPIVAFSLGSVTASSDTAICVGSSAMLNATGAATYSWSPATGLSDPNIANPVATPTATTTYIVTGTDINGCSANDTVTVSILAPPAITMSPDTSICLGDSTQISAAGGVSYSWSPAASLSCTACPNPLAFPTTATDYYVTVTDTNGCINTDTVHVNVNLNPGEIISADTAVCVGEPLELVAIGGGTYSWSPATGLSATNVANPIATPADTTTYTVTVTSPEGCVATDQVTVNVVQYPVATAGPDTAVCEGQSVQLFATGGASYSWSPAAGLSATNIANPVASPASTTTYIVTVSNAFGCAVVDSATVTINTLPNVGFVAVDSIGCRDLNANFTDLTSASTAISSWAWNLGDGTNSALQNPTNTYTTAGIYNVSLVVTDNNGCIDSISKPIIVHDLPVVAAIGDTTVCEGSAAPLSASGAASYSWTPAASLDNALIANPLATPSTSTTYIVTGTDINGCTDTDTVTVGVNPIPVATAGPDASICEGDTTTLSAAGGVSYSWSPSTGLSNPNIANPLASPATTTAYVVTVADAIGCTDTDTVNVIVNPVLGEIVSSDTSVCVGSPVELIAIDGGTYSWSPATGLSATNIANPIALPTDTTTYTVTVTSDSGCVATDQVTVNVVQYPVATTGPDTAVCEGQSVQLFATGGDNYSWSPATGLSATNIANPVASPASTTTYVVTVSNAFGCSVIDSTTVTINALPNVDFVAVDSIGCRDLNANFTDLTSASTAISSWAWDLGDGTNSALQNPANTYTTAGTYNVSLVVTDNNGCIDSISKPIIVHDLPVVSAIGDTAICLGDIAPLSASGAASYSWTPAASLDNALIANPIATPSTSTTYIVTGTDVNGCTDTDTVDVIVNPLPIASAGPDASICEGDTTNLSAAGGVTYAWSPASGLSDPNIANPAASPAATTNYVVTVTDANSCVDMDTVTVTVNPVLGGIVSSDTSVCVGSPVELLAIDGGTYSWSPATGLSATNIANPIALPTDTITYTVTITSDSGCVATDQVTVNVVQYPVATASPDTAVCEGQSVQLFATGGDSYSWSPATGLSATNIANPIASPASTTTYVVTVSNAFGCSVIDSATVVVNALPEPAFVAIDSVGCVELTANFSDLSTSADPITSYAWRFGDGNSSAIANPTNIYTTAGVFNATLVLTTNQGCVDSVSKWITVHSLPNIVATADTTLCIGDVAPLSANGAVSYVWSPAATLNDPFIFNPQATPSSNTTYVVSGTDINGCVNTDTVQVDVVPLPTVGITFPDPEICEGDSAQLNASGGLTYTWSPAASLTNPNVHDPIAYPSSSTNYVVTVTDANGCSDTGSVSVIVNAIPTGLLSNDTSICVGDPVVLNAAGGGTYAWGPATGLSCTNCPSPVATPTDTTTYYVLVTSPEGCTNDGYVTVNAVPYPVATAGPDTNLCLGESVRLTATGGDIYTWTPPTYLSCTNCANPMVNTPTADITYNVNISNNFGCSVDETVTINVHELPVVNAGAGVTLCRGESFDIMAAGNADFYNWTPAAGLNATTILNPTATPDSTTTYVITGTTNFGCSATDSLTIEVLDKLMSSITQDTVVCRGQSVQLNLAILDSSELATTNYMWDPPRYLDNPFIQNPTSTPDNDITYTVVVQGGLCEADTQTVNITVLDAPYVNAGADATVVSGTPIQMSPIGPSGTSYAWTPAELFDCPDCMFPTFTVEESTLLTVTVTDDYGCSYTDSVNVLVRDQCQGDLMFVPNTFTPNGDGTNDVVKINSIGITEINYFRIYNRWGELLFETNDISQGWDGYHLGQEMNPGVYVYQIEAICSNRDVVLKAGNVTLIR